MYKAVVIEPKWSRVQTLSLSRHLLVEKAKRVRGNTMVLLRPKNS